MRNFLKKARSVVDGFQDCCKTGLETGFLFYGCKLKDARVIGSIKAQTTINSLD